jgi:transmembrane sensor
MDDNQLELLLDKLASGSYTPQEEQQARAFIHQYNAEGKSGLTDEDFLGAEAAMWVAIEQAGQSKTRKLSYWKPAIAAAVAMMIFGAGLFYYAKQSNVGISGGVLLSRDIAPGKNGATLTLTNGKVVELSGEKAGVVIGDSDLQYNDETPVIPNREGFLLNNPNDSKMTASTAMGRTYQITLPDGSKVWLNAASSITFPATFSKQKERRIKLSGEAYFEISKDKDHPFVVVTHNQEVTVLGTHFNINSYADETVTKTTLLEGSVRISLSGGGQSVVLKPNQQAVLSPSGMAAEDQTASFALTTLAADPELEMAWKNNDFYFKSESMESVMRKVARWYNVTVNYTDSQLKSVPISGFMSRTKPISIVLDRLGAAGHMRFKIEGQTVTVISK